jgi:hypothetical protein
VRFFYEMFCGSDFNAISLLPLGSRGGCDSNQIYFSKEVVQTLLAKGADMDAKDNDGSTALMVASQNGHLEVVLAATALAVVALAVVVVVAVASKARARFRSAAQGWSGSSYLGAKIPALLALALTMAPMASAGCSTAYGTIDANGHLLVPNTVTSIAECTSPPF